MIKRRLKILALNLEMFEKFKIHGGKVAKPESGLLEKPERKRNEE